MSAYISNQDFIDYINKTCLKCNEETIDVVRDFVTDHMGEFICPLDTSMETISEYQIEIRHLIEPYMKLRLPYLVSKKFKNQDFYALFILLLVIDQVNEYNWDHVNSLVFFKYNENDKDSHNQYGLVMRDEFFGLEECHGGGELSGINCCCSKPEISRRLSTKVFNGKYTFILGSHCIKKTSIAYYKIKDSKVKKYDRQKKKEEQQRLRRLQLEEQQRLEREAERLRIQATTMMCRGYGCGKRIPRCDWRVRCNRCYAILMSEQ